MSSGTARITASASPSPVRASWGAADRCGPPRVEVPASRIGEILAAWHEAGCPAPFPLDVRWFRRTGKWALQRVVDPPKPAKVRPVCGAKTRAGGTCKRSAVWDYENDRPTTKRGRCRNHGGIVPRTAGKRKAVAT